MAYIVDLYNKTPWNVTDLFFANNLRGLPIAATNKLLTKQYPGYSILEKLYNENERF